MSYGGGGRGVLIMIICICAFAAFLQRRENTTRGGTTWTGDLGAHSLDQQQKDSE